MGFSTEVSEGELEIRFIELFFLNPIFRQMFLFSGYSDPALLSK